MIDMHSDVRFFLFQCQYEGCKCPAGSSISSHISRHINIKLTLGIVFVHHIDVHIQSFSIYAYLSKTRAFEKSVLYCLIRPGFPFRTPYRLYPQHATHTWSFCKEMYHNVCRYKYLTFQTEIHIHNQYIFDTNND